MKKVVRNTILILIILVLTAILAAGVWFYARYGKDLALMYNDAKQVVAVSSEATFRCDQTSLLYDSEGEVIAEIKGAKDAYYLDVREIPAMAIEAMISTEDKKFYKHHGIDLKAVVRAVKSYIDQEGEITQGGSTITQQLARNIFLNFDETFERKAREAFIAIELEKKYSKADIIEFYLNNIYFANGFYGIQSAALGYYDRGVQELSLSELCFILAIPNSPSRYDPYLHYDETLARRDRILGQMYADGKITADEYSTALDEKIIVTRKENVINNYVETYAYRCAIEALMKREGFVMRYSFTDDEDEQRYMDAYNSFYTRNQMKLFTAGYRIYTSIDMEKQNKLQKALDKGLEEDKETNSDGVYELQGSAVTIDNETGRVVAIVGGRSQDLYGYTLNRAFQSYRQPGSSIKPLVVYTPSFERGYYPEDKVDDVKRKDGPANVDFAYAGTTTIEYAVAVSKNTVAWDLFAELTPEKGLRYLTKMGFSRISREHDYMSAVLGGMYRGVSAVEMTSGFATLENEGEFREPTCIVSITDADGHVIVDDRIESTKIYEPEATRKMIYCMQKVMEKGTGRKGRLDNISCAGKTGTTNENKDRWFVGFTKYYTTGVWVGYDMPRNMDHLSDDTEPVIIWKEYMENLHIGLEDVPFPDYIRRAPEKEKEKKKPEKEKKEEAAEEIPKKEENVENDDEDIEETDDVNLDQNTTDNEIEDDDFGEYDETDAEVDEESYDVNEDEFYD